MSAKDNFAQAMKELLNGEGGEPQAAGGEERRAPANSFSSFSQPGPLPVRQEEEPDEFPAEEAPRFASYSAQQAAYAPAPPPSAPEFRSAAPVYSAPAAYAVAPVQPSPAFAAPAQQPVVPAVPAVPVEVSGEATVIADGTTIIGDITTAAGLRVDGNVKGNLKVATLLELNGKVIGDIEAGDAVCAGAVVRGNVSVGGSLTVDDGCTLVGDVMARGVDIDGKIKGNMTVEERARFQQNAVLVGNLAAVTVVVDEGAVLKGDVAITTQNSYVEVDETGFDIG